MPGLINSIILTSGTVVKIPIFPAPHEKELPADYTIDTRSGGVLVVYGSSTSSTFIQTLSDDDLLELGNILLSTEHTDIDYEYNRPSPEVGAKGIAFLAWQVNVDGDYVLSSSFTSHDDKLVFRYNVFGSASFSTKFYNNANQYSVPSDFNDYVNDHNKRDPTPVWNVREGGVFSVDIATRSNLTTLLGSFSYSMDQLLDRISRYQETHPESNVSISIYDPESNTDPYIVDDPADFGGGGGSREDPDNIEKATIPDLPSVSAVDTGLITLYMATNSQLQALGAYLWSNIYDLDANFVKLFSNPMDCLIGLSIVPVMPSIAGAQNVKFGNITTNIALQKLSSQFVSIDCGTINVKEYIGSFLDYSPYVNISIYLPYIGYRELSPDDVMNDTIHVVYHIDVLSGGCCAMIETGKKGLLYSFNGSAITNVPITAINYSGAIQNAISAVGAGLTTVAGIATGSAPITAQGIANAANTAINSKPQIQRSGSMGGSAGLMSYQKPMLIITRPRQSVPAKLNKFVGLTTNVTMLLSQVKGFTMIDHIHLDSIKATQNEKDELRQLLKEGVIF